MFRAVLSIFAISLSAACATWPQPKPADAPHALPVWRIEGNGLAKPSYLFGVMYKEYNHEWYTPELEKTISSAEVIGLELDRLERDLYEDLLKERGRYPDGDSFDKHAPAPLLKRTLAAADKLKMPEDRVQAWQPWAVYLWLGRAQADSQKLTHVYGAENVVTTLAGKHDIPIVSLDRHADQLEAIATSSAAEQWALLEGEIASVESSTVTDQQVNEKREAWRRGDLSTFEAEQLELSEDPQWSNFYGRVYRDRNAKIFERMMPLIEAKSALIAVGASRLVGPDGLIAKLKERGYDLVQLQATP